jgi:hypothetical protein
MEAPTNRIIMIVYMYTTAKSASVSTIYSVIELARRGATRCARPRSTSYKHLLPAVGNLHDLYMWRARALHDATIFWRRGSYHGRPAVKNIYSVAPLRDFVDHTLPCMVGPCEMHAHALDLRGTAVLQLYVLVFPPYSCVYTHSIE